MIAPAAQNSSARAEASIRFDQLGHGKLFDDGAGHVHGCAQTTKRSDRLRIGANPADP